LRSAALTAARPGFFAKVYEAVRAIPRGRVLTYGELALLLGLPRGARAVGWALRALPPRQADSVPWHRVVGKGGRISPRPGAGALLQARRLRVEGVRFRRGCVDIARHGLLVVANSGAPRYSRPTRGRPSRSRARCTA
jgi:methylated-DNA-protein-cysteine methyltransferase-like protein